MNEEICDINMRKMDSIDEEIKVSKLDSIDKHLKIIADCLITMTCKSCGNQDCEGCRLFKYKFPDLV